MSGIDPLLLHSSHTEEATNDDTGPQDWNSLWSDQQQSAFKSYMDLTDFSIGMDLDYASMGIDPQFNPAALNFSYDEDPNPMSCATFADAFPVFSFQDSPKAFTKERRLSITSSSSSSGASLSPMPDLPPSPPSSDNVSAKDEPNASVEFTNPYMNDPAGELAHHVRQTAGVMLAVPMNGFAASFQAGAHVAAGKLPIPRLSRPASISSPKSSNAPTSSVSSAASTPPPSTPPSSSNSPINISPSSAPTPTSVPPPPALPRPKTSHTTIERRYRTNLNARIQSLRMAVPALRVLEDRDGSNGKKIKKNIKGGVIVKGAGIGIETSEDGTVVDVIDERGFVDGVKVARKCSKANVLGKAVEYIRVLKKREQRLKAEQAGLKALISGLVGGPALIKEWEKQWRSKFGGEEKDEVEGEDEEPDDDESEDEDGDDGDEEGGRKRKRPKLSSSSGTNKKATDKKDRKPVPPVVVLTSDHNGNPVPEKRKRGRPRKILPPPVTLEPVTSTAAAQQDESMPPAEHWQPQQQPQQYLLAVFALFSFFNSPFTSSSQSNHPYHHHTGKVLTPVHPPLAYSPEIISQFIPTSPPISASWAWKEYVQLFHLLVSLLVLASFVVNWFGFNIGSAWTFEFGLVKKRNRKSGSCQVKNCRVVSSARGNEIDWIKLAEEFVVSGEPASLSYLDCLQIYRTISDTRKATANNLATAAIALNDTTGLLGGLVRLKARSIWAEAAAKHKVQQSNKISDQLVFSSMDVDAACVRIASLVKNGGQLWDNNREEEAPYSLLESLACMVVKERVKWHLGKLFVEVVVGEDQYEEGGRSIEMNTKKKEEVQERRKTVEAARDLGGSAEDLGRLFARIWKTTGSVDMDDVDHAFGSSRGVDEELKSLFTSIVLYTRLFGDDTAAGSSSSDETECPSSMSSSTVTVVSTLLSPPPSPKTEKMGTTTTTTTTTSSAYIDTSLSFSSPSRMLFDLRKALGSRVFEDGGSSSAVAAVMGSGSTTIVGLEEARDTVVDLIVDVERRERVCRSPL